ncbi:hypothetical protein PO587_38805 [Streptomyces gilvifuscus]|uniref:Fungal lipase-like domain-containing protein n=1 Tax=Streptomyces gilvifuscus TaxID=1550617 RepID=A0ABT5G6L9_9ACTN|nr:hypothetical protein [Streptomyces gilvifuscus]MDC2960393.1 hypothetical protein [Streptomyces gilvifuscus]
MHRTALARACLADPLLRGPGPLSIIDCYWGDLGGSFAWDHASLPSFAPTTESFGSPIADTSEPNDEEHPGVTPILAAALRSCLPDAVDLLWDAVWPHLRGEDAAPAAALVAQSSAYALREPHPGWLDEVSDDQELLTALTASLTAQPSLEGERSPVETFGAGAGRHLALARLREGALRLAQAAPRVGSTALLSRARRPFHLNIALFLGDVLVFVQQQGSVHLPGPITRRVAAAVEEAEQHRSSDDPYLIVIAHSLGGSICLDLLSRPESLVRCEIDALVTVGSQVGLLAELGLFPHLLHPSSTAPQPVPAPSSIKRWLNVYDIDDSLSFLASPVFEGAEDFRYSTGRGLFHAHSSYLDRPSFFLRLANHLAERQI